MFGMGMSEILVIVIVALLFIGPDKLPGVARSIGKGIRELRRQTRDLQDTIEQDEELGSTVRELRASLRGDLPRDPVMPKPPKPPPAVPPPPAKPEDEGPHE